jgi:hypothetical protein
MANGIAIKDVDNKLQSLAGEEVIPISTGANEPEVVEVDTLKEYINEDIDTALGGKQDVINDLDDIRSGATLGASALQDSDISDWAKAPLKPSYSYSEITGKPTLSAVATSGSYNDLTNTPTIPDVPEWAMSSTKPSYTVSEIDGAQEELVSGTNIKTINGTSILGSGNITIQGGGSGDVNVIETVKVNGSALVPDANKAVDITVPDVSGKVDKVSNPTNGNFASLDSNGNLVDSGHKHSDYLTSHQDLSNYVQKSQTSGLLKNDGSVDTNTYLTQHQDISGKEDKSNKVTSLSASSTDTQYPSAKAVYDLVGDIETILASI